MGHATHFLQRLDRVSDGHVELALTLYRDQALLQEVLSRADAPDDVERLAISLDDPVEGPFIVVTREGRFVTCLAAGMLVSGLPIVTRERLDAAAARVTRMREQLERVRALRESGADGEAALAFRRMQQQGPRFAREDAETLLKVQPLIENTCMVRFGDLYVALLESAPVLATLRLDAPRRLPSRAKDFLLKFGDGVWALAHLIVLLRSETARELMVQAEEEGPEGPPMMEALGRAVFEWGTFMHVSRGLWFVARGGKPVLAAVKGRPARWFHECAYREMALTSIALGSDKRRAEAQKALSARRAPSDAELKTMDPSTTFSAVFGASGRSVLDKRDVAEALHLRLGQVYAAQVLAGRADVSEEEIQAIPEHVARPAIFTRQASMFADGGTSDVLWLMYGLSWLARASPAELFLPAEWAQQLTLPGDIDAVARWFRPYAQEHRLMPVSREPRRAASRPGRNAPCPCGSGAKYKRCCAAAS